MNMKNKCFLLLPTHRYIRKVEFSEGYIHHLNTQLDNKYIVLKCRRRL